MMLLQAGQLGLYRRASIWTDEIPPDMVAGATMWLDFTDPATVFPNDDLTGTSPSDGESVLSVKDKALTGIAGAKFFSGTPLKAKLPGANGGGVARREGESLQMEVLSSFPSTNAYAQTLVTTTTKLVIVAVNVRAAGAYTSNPWTANTVISDAGGYFGIHLMQSDVGDGSLIATAYNYSSGTERADRPIATNQWQVITLSQQAGSLRCRVNGGAWAATPSTATGTLANNARLLDGATLDADIAHIATVNTAQTDAAISAVEHWMALDVGITPWW